LPILRKQFFKLLGFAIAGGNNGYGRV
jgi:hypothetical protein